MNGNLGQLVMVTRAEEAEGFPPLLAEMLWRGNFSRRPEYSVFARGLGPGMVDYVATVFIPRRFVEGVTEAHNISAHGTSIEMAIQEVAYKAMAILRQEVIELERHPFTHFPIQGPLQGVNVFEMGMGGASLYERRMSELVAAQDRSLYCIRAELRETRRRFNELQRTVDMYVRMGRVPQDVLYGPNDYTPHEAAPLELRFPLVQSIYLPQHVVGQARMSNGLRVRRFAPTTLTREIIFGGEHAPLTHPENPEDTGSPRYHLLDDFPPYFARGPYGPF